MHTLPSTLGGSIVSNPQKGARKLVARGNGVQREGSGTWCGKETYGPIRNHHGEWGKSEIQLWKRLTPILAEGYDHKKSQDARGEIAMYTNATYEFRDPC
ncbi:hypothetical protein KQX54_006886 [Cotesia glomerata]|uniref:Uncharacterized protein n=1 Tax=Cotesia glomerata TaxID=32391 RepID=A0AAV7HS58_COTGL|nr:hypothetical protein KQX54_006886 [Cotesia glomerata]